MKIFLTGATGFIGKNLAVKLSKMGHCVRCLVRDLNRAAWMKQHNGLEPIKGDLEHPKTIIPYLGDIVTVFHLAGVNTAKHREEYFRINGEGAGNLFESVLSAGKNVRKILYVSSLAVAGPHTAKYPAQENGEVSPITHYGESKLRGEQLLKEKCKDIPWTIIRPPAVYGPFDKQIFVYFRMAKLGVVPIMGKGKLELSMIHVDDVTDGVILAAFTEKSDGEIFHLSDGGVHTWEEIAKLIIKIKGGGKVIRVPSIFGKIAGVVGDGIAYLSNKPQVINSQKVKEALQDGWVCNTDKIRAHLGFIPNVELENGFESTYHWYRNAGWL
ncbi:MAG: NAD-dependent epimerase/dehydratase family protein [Deltaproteobacteria bacterium]|nr:MAG: NAD-dependent epimerase/dehydratase family protein [Deltaproteobacteria bacterium]